MATAIINIETYRQQRAERRKQDVLPTPAADRLWEYLTLNLKIDVGASRQGERT